MTDTTQWRRCSACKNPIALGSKYWVCNVSTCNRKRTALVFCSVTCWEVHLPGANHRESWAEERMAPDRPDPVTGADAGRGRTGSRRIVREASASSPGPDVPEEILVIASRLRDYIRARSGFNTSEQVLAPLSAMVRRVCDTAIANATRDERTTVLDRDIPTK